MKNITRRKFIQKSSVGIAALSTGSLLVNCTKDKNVMKPGEEEITSPLIPQRTLGNTGLEVSTLSFGGGSQFMKNDEGDWQEMLEKAIEMGINLFDTASAYDYDRDLTSEQRYGEILPQHRDKVLISTKFDSRNVSGMMAEVETSLNHLKTDYVDFLLIHSLDDSDTIAALETTIWKQMDDLKTQGVAGNIGFSSMNSANRSKEFIEKLNPDVAILAMNPTQYGDFANTALPAAREKNVGILAMKVMKNIVGVSATAEELIGYVLGQEGVSSALIAHYGLARLLENIEIVNQLDGKSLSKLKYENLEKRCAHLAGPHALCWARPDYVDGKTMC